MLVSSHKNVMSRGSRTGKQCDTPSGRSTSVVGTNSLQLQVYDVLLSCVEDVRVGLQPTQADILGSGMAAHRQRSSLAPRAS